MSNDETDSVVGDDPGPSYDRDETNTDDSDVTMDTAPPRDDSQSDPTNETGDHAGEPPADPLPGQRVEDEIPSPEPTDEENTIKCGTCGATFAGPDRGEEYESHFDRPCHKEAAIEQAAIERMAEMTGEPAPARAETDSTSPPWYERLGAVVKNIGGKRPTFTVAGKTIRVDNWLDPKDNATIGPVTFMSNVSEKHALGVGYIVTLAVAVPVILGMDPMALLASIVGGTLAAQRIIRRGLKTAHVSDAASELAYTGLGAALALVTILGLAAAAVALQRDPATIAERFLRFVRVAFETQTG